MREDGFRVMWGLDDDAGVLQYESHGSTLDGLAVGGIVAAMTAVVSYAVAPTSAQRELPN